MNIIFSAQLLIKKINYINHLKLYGTCIYNSIEYKFICTQYQWISENIRIFGYGIINKNTITLEVVIPDLTSQTNLFSAFLLSMEIKGLSKTKIELLEKSFGTDLYTLFFENKFDAINSILQYEKEKIDIIIQKWQKINVYCLLHINLITLGLSAKSIKKVYKTYKENAIKVIRENPYQMIESIGFGFKTVDQIALEYGIQKDSTLRIIHGFLHILEENEIEGHTYINKNILYEKVSIILTINDINVLEKGFNKLIDEKQIICIDDKVGKIISYQYESYIAYFFKKNQKKNKNNNQINDVSLSQEQQLAILGAIENKYTIITGSAGTGKSTVIKAIYKFQKMNYKKIIVLTPTGRASQRIKEIDASIETMTIHKALTQIAIYNILKNQEYTIDYLDYDHIIIDESSMIDSALLYVILKMVKKSTSITFLGDASQLPPIGIGYPFSILIEKGAIAIYYLTKIFRQKEHTSLLIIAKNISNGIYPKISTHEWSDCSFKNTKKEDLNNVLISFIDTYYNRENNALDIQCVTFLNRGNCGVNKINILIQSYIHTTYTLNLPLLLNRFYKHDRVVVLKNNYILNVRNGEIGRVINGDNNQVIVAFNDNKIINFSINEIHLLQLAYVINVYKSQGSEFQNVLILLYLEQYILLNKKALYTALTRAKKKAIIVGERKALYCAINNKNNNKRNTFLELLL